MGNAGSNGGGGGPGHRRRSSGHGHGHHHQAPPPPQQPEAAPNRYVFAAATPYPPQYPNPNPSAKLRRSHRRNSCRKVTPAAEEEDAGPRNAGEGRFVLGTYRWYGPVPCDAAVL